MNLARTSSRKPSNINDWIRRSLKDEPPRSKSLIVTIFGDSLLPYVPSIWLGELTALLRPFHVNAQLTRTSCFRLAEEEWLESRREGRRSRYALTPSGQQRIQLAYARIYAPLPKEWDGDWTIVIPNKTGNPIADRAELRREFEWEGFGLLGPGIFIHPHSDVTGVRVLLDRLGLTRSVTVFQARESRELFSLPPAVLASECWNLDEVAARYTHFLQRFQPVLPLLKKPFDPQTAFVVQTLLIHSFRRVVLHDPGLRCALLPKDWPGHAAYDLCREIYSRTFQETRSHLLKHIEQGRNRSFTPASDLYNRFGGLPRP